MMVDNKQDVQNQFGKNAASYVSSPIHKDGRDLLKIIEIASLSGIEVLLDVASGGGHTAKAFAPLVKKVIALDLTKEMLLAAENYIKIDGHKNVEFVLGDAEKLPFPNHSFEIVSCRIAPHHFPNVQQFSNEAARVLKENGQFLLIDNVVPEDDELDEFYNKIEKMRDYSHYRAWKKSEWLKMLESSGFHIEELYRFEKTFDFEPWCNRMQLTEEEKQKLTRYILNASVKVKEKFKIVIENQAVQTFVGESVIIKAVKK